MSSENGASPYRIEVRDVWKSYRLGQLVSLEKTMQFVGDKLRRRYEPEPKFNALSGISFEVAAGECFAVIGENGAGKSTLAQILAGITIPSAGEIVTRGRVLPLLSFKAGFQGELTARENVVMFGALLGLGARNSRAAIPRIVEFAEIDEKHLRTPIKRFSTGQLVRIAFATALCLPADVYLFDEVLNAADDSFKTRCVAEIRSLVEGGAAAVFISHELELVRAVCTRGIWLEHSKPRMTGPIDELARAYHEYAEAHAVVGSAA